MDIKEFIKKIQSLSEDKKKIIFWALVVIVAIGLLFLWVKNAETRLSRIKNSGEIEKLMPNLSLPALPNQQDLLKDTATGTK